MNIKEKICFVINEAYPALKLLQNDYYIIGSSALILSGIELENTYDVDILTSNEDAEFLKKIWKDKIKPNHITQRDDLFRSSFSRYSFQKLDIEVMGNLEVNKNGIWTQLNIHEFKVLNVNGNPIKLPTIKEQKRILNFFGREKDREKIKLIETSKINDSH